MAAPQTILSLLENLRGIEPLKQLFWVELNYDRVNDPVNELPDGTVDLVAEPPLRLATGGSDKNFHIIYVKLKTERLRKTDERQIIAHLQTWYPDALYVFSNVAQEEWHFINVKLAREKKEKSEQHERDVKSRTLFRRITIAPDERLRTAAERIAMLDLEELGEQDTFLESRELLTALEIRKCHEEAFNVEAVTEAFFEGYKRIFGALQTELRHQTDDVKWVHDWSQQFLSRCLFLYFVQRKRWLGNDIEFLRTFWEAYQDSPEPTNTFVEKWLNVLFFKAFNNQFHGGYAYFPVKIRETLQLAPYLNGGLFRENELDMAYAVSVSDELWQNIFNFFERYNFTIAEDTPLDQEVAVDPEMIGRVYESLVSEEEERGDGGIFYTERVEIDLMCRLALVDNLANHIGTAADKLLFYETLFAFEPKEKEDADAKLADIWGDIHKHLTEMTVLDPACGSGSFLVGMLHVLDDLCERAGSHLDIQTESRFERRKTIIGKNLYGVDVKQWACKVAELRLWLALIIDAEFDLAELAVRKDALLPDFSFNIRHGDSIVQDIGGMNLAQTRALGSGVPSDMKRKITNLQTEKLRFYHNDPDRKYTKKEEIKAAENSLFRELIQSYNTEISKSIRSLKTWLEDPAEQLMFADMKQPETRQLDFETLKKQEELKRHEENLAQVERARDALSSDKMSPFVWDIAFVEIFSQCGGFDIVIENPPYIRQEDIRDLMLPRDEGIKTTNKQVYKAKLARAVYQVHPKFFGYQPKKDIKPDKPEASVKHKLNGRSDLYVYFYFHGLSLVNPKGTFCTITSNSWLDVAYGAKLQEFILKQCQLKMVLDNSAKRSFAAADVNTVISLISAPNGHRESGLQHLARFVNFTVPFEAILDAVIFYEIETASVRVSAPEHCIHPLLQRSLLVHGTGENARYIGDKWGGKYLRAPDIYWTLLEKGKDKLVRLEDISEVNFGIKTGVDRFFYLDDERIQEWGIESEFLKPAIKSPREGKRILVDPSQLQFKLFMCHADKAALAGTAALDYIKWGESQGFHRRPSCRSRNRWWDLGKWGYPDMLWQSAYNVRFGCFENAGDYFGGARFSFIEFKEKNSGTIRAYLNSTIIPLLIETEGIANLGEGVIQTNVYWLKTLPILAENHIAKEIHECYETIKTREILSIFDEIHQPDRRALDSIIFDALGLTQGERDGVYEGVIQLVTNRLQKAKSK